MKPLHHRLASSLKTSLVANWGQATPRAARSARPDFFGSGSSRRIPGVRASSSIRSPRAANLAFQRGRTLAPLLAVAVAAGVSAFAVSRNAYAEAPPAPKAPSEEEDNDSIRKIRLADVGKHDGKSGEPWVMRGTRVYDITEWISIHPGGEVAMRAAGGSLEPFWKIFAIHQKQEVYDILEEYFIGVIDPQDLVDGQVPVDAIEDPFKNDPTRDERLLTHTDRPCNAETPATELSDYITPNRLFYVRNHMWVPETPESEHKLTVELADGTEKTYTMEDLRRKFKEHTITAVLQCSGNRRSHMSAAVRKTNGLPWDVGAIGNAEWTGVRLRDVLADAGLDVDEPDEDSRHAWFMGAEAYSASIPIDKAVDRRGDTLLAYKMNGETLPRDHGYPLRALVPGNVAARSVKWLNRITISEEESYSQWQRRDYKCFGPNVGDKPDWDAAPSIQEMPVQSAVTCVKELRCGNGVGGGAEGGGSSLSEEDQELRKVYGINGNDDCVKVEGYAFAGGGRRIVRVDISADDGRTWNQAHLVNCEDGKGSKSWGWQRWRFGIPKSQCGKCFLVKAIDEGYNQQPDNFDSHFNHRGNLASGWHKAAYKEAATRAEAARAEA